MNTDSVPGVKTEVVWHKHISRFKGETKVTDSFHRHNVGKLALVCEHKSIVTVYRPANYISVGNHYRKKTNKKKGGPQEDSGNACK